MFCRNKFSYLLFFVLTFLAIQPSQAARVKGVLSNFDLFNNFTGTDDIIITVGLTLEGITDCKKDITGYWTGSLPPSWGMTGLEPSDGCSVAGDVATIVWCEVPAGLMGCPKVGTTAWKYGEQRHFGVHFRAGISPKALSLAFVTYNTMTGKLGTKLLAFARPGWTGTEQCPVGTFVTGIMSPDTTVIPCVTITDWQWAFTPNFIPLNNLTNQDPQVQSLSFTLLVAETTLCQDESLSYFTPPISTSGAVVTQFTVSQGDTVIGHWTNEAIVEPSMPTLSQWGLIIFSFLLLSYLTYFLYRRRKLTTPTAFGIFLLVFTLAFYISYTI